MDNKFAIQENEKFNEYIKRIREFRGLTQRKLSLITGISNTNISRIEKGGQNGGIENFDIDTITKLAEGLSIPKEQMLIASGYLDKKEGSIKSSNMKEILENALLKLGWVNSPNDINEDTICFVESLLKKYGNKNK